MNEVFSEFDHKNHVITVDHVPNWVTAGDVIIDHNPRKATFRMRSLTQSEPRWVQRIRPAMRRLAVYLKRWVETH